ncbi:uncharacterized protein NECHADRAFT_86024 [Fusarium vanettenii 77-13-4]|uniref:Uncharacterized protein n=1 Tax=Fusarium vanettenii (strain ATCC MYA-4622 / CBS 123669 / FGSC 9596 / NRRL 45880 / 77-13-4) TaxID=660122 RepID=C7Z248_FUSV7|nr:uncharacterized protein NECHADRAFT_86024 [Fusarium vanettenii 77-13-4]EEU42111.1 predicted protein [Fusarium vanettenii 77-13-4]
MLFDATAVPSVKVPERHRSPAEEEGSRCEWSYGLTMGERMGLCITWWTRSYSVPRVDIGINRDPANNTILTTWWGIYEKYKRRETWVSVQPTSSGSTAQRALAERQAHAPHALQKLGIAIEGTWRGQARYHSSGVMSGAQGNWFKVLEVAWGRWSWRTEDGGDGAEMHGRRLDAKRTGRAGHVPRLGRDGKETGDYLGGWSPKPVSCIISSPTGALIWVFKPTYDLSVAMADGEVFLSLMGSI